MKTQLLTAERKAVEKTLFASERPNLSFIASTSDYVYTLSEQSDHAIRALCIPAATKTEVSARGGRIGGLPFRATPADMPEWIASIRKHIDVKA